MSSSVAKHIRGNVVAYVALFFAVTGAAYAVTKVAPRNSVVSKSIKNRQVKGVDLARNSVKGPKVRDGSLTGADLGANSLTGAQINESSLGAVPNADHAASADSATTATSATSADSATHATSADSATHATSADTAVHALFANPIQGDPEAALATAGPFTISQRCEIGAGSVPTADLLVNGPSGSEAVTSEIVTDNDMSLLSPPSTSAKAISGDTQLFGASTTAGHFHRVAGTAFLNTSGGTLVELDFVVTTNANTLHCSYRGTAALAN